MIGLLPSLARASVCAVGAVLASSALAQPGPLQEGARTLATVEQARPRIVARMIEAQRDALRSRDIPTDAFAAALWSLPPPQLLAASLEDDLEGITAIVAASAGTAERASPKDGSGSGASSWIGYTAGSNVASGPGSAVAAGKFNAATGANSFVAAGQSNVASGTSSLVIGGFDNRAAAIDSLVGAGAGNRATGARAVVLGGGYNLASGQWSVVGGGGRASGSGAAGTQAEDNVAAGNWSTIAGGIANRATEHYTAIGGGNDNRAFGRYAVVAGGDGNSAIELSTTVGGGSSNFVSGISGTVAGGSSNVATNGGAAVGGGTINSATGPYATVPGGLQNVAAGKYSMAFGRDANALHDSSVIFGGWFTGTASTFRPNTFQIHGEGGLDVEYGARRADGGGTSWVLIGSAFAGQAIATSTGAYLSSGGTWTNNSDRARKHAIVPVDPEDVLARLRTLPVARWQYRDDVPGVTHVGPMAQDFHAAFDVGPDGVSISTIDSAGVALAAIQGLDRRLADALARSRAEVAELRAALDTLREEIARLGAATPTRVAFDR